MTLAKAMLDPNAGSLTARVAGMAARVLARRMRSKSLPLRAATPMVSFTFDDVPVSACERAAPILEKHGARGTFYVVGSGCGTAGPGGPLRASIEQLRTIWNNGHEIGCHTYSHPAVRHVSLDELKSEIDRNKAALQKIDRNIVLRNFAYPYGDLSVRTKRYLESRFDSCRSTHGGINSVVADLGALDSWLLTDAAFDRAGIATLIRQTVQRSGWLIFYSHDVVEQPSGFGVSPDLLEWTIGAAKQAGCALTTIAEGLTLIREAEGARLRAAS
jgi:peptidoglycan/xylan/chitin deacetylase (PgdA/CDA1 family)